MNELFLGFYFGVICTVLLYNLQWYINSKEKSYFYYILMHLSLLFVFLHVYEIIQTSILFTIAFTVVFSILFSKEFLNLKKYYPHFDRFFGIFIGIYLLFILTLYFTNTQKVLGHIPQFVIFLPFLILGYIIYKKGNKLALYFLFGWGVFTLGTIISYVLNNTIGGNETSRIIVQGANLLEMIILSFALSKKTKILMEEKNQQEKMLIHQSRLASMGEMLANISHQWRQPLNRVASFIMNMQLHIYDHYKEEKFLLGKLDESQAQLEYMSSTIDDFSNFYKKDKIKEHFKVSSAVKNAIKIIQSSLNAQNITLRIESNNDFELYSYPKELSQVILNLLQNAKDQLIIQKIKDPEIILRIERDKILVLDNAKGIKEEIINQIFDPYFTTKEKHQGTGLGLYMSKVILEKNFNAQIDVQNINNGAQFCITFSEV